MKDFVNLPLKIYSKNDGQFFPLIPNLNLIKLDKETNTFIQIN